MKGLGGWLLGGLIGRFDGFDGSKGRGGGRKGGLGGEAIAAWPWERGGAPGRVVGDPKGSGWVRA